MQRKKMKGDGSQPPLSAAQDLIKSVGGDGQQSTSIAFPVITVSLFVVIALVYVWIAKVTSEGVPILLADVVDRTSIFKADDSFRFYIAKAAWRDIGNYVWNYTLPVCVFLDGILTTLARHDLFLSRATHILPAFLTLWFVYKAGRGLGLDRRLMVLSTLVLALMPLYAFVFLSFYGENWLALFVSASTCAFVYRRYTLTAVIIGFMPLIRAEGFFLMLPFWAFFLKERQYRNFIIAGLPGFAHFISIFLVHDQFQDYLGWRFWYRRVSNVVYADILYRNRLLSSFNPLWTLPAIASFFLPGMRRLWPVWGGVLVWVFWVSGSIFIDQLYYESRYFVSVLPTIALGWSFFFTWLGQQPLLKVNRAGWLALFSVLYVFTVAEHFLQLDPIKYRYGAGQRWPIADKALLVDHFIQYPSWELKARKNMAEAIYGIIEKNPEVDSVIIFTENIFRALEPDRIPRRVRVSWAPISSHATLGILQNNFYVMHPVDKQFAIYHFSTLDRRKRGPVALYAGELDCQLCVPIYSAGEYKLYAFSYDVSHEIKKIPSRKLTLDCKREKNGELICR